MKNLSNRAIELIKEAKKYNVLTEYNDIVDVLKVEGLSVKITT